MLEVSFPALRGASGAPVFTWTPPYSMFGVLSQNYARELHPAQVERIVGDNGEMQEEQRFYLPQGLAVHVRHVRDLLRDLLRDVQT